MSDFFMSNTDDYWKKKNEEAQQQNYETQINQNTDTLSKNTEAYKQKKEQHYENWNRYGVEVPDEYYEVFNNIISQASTPEEAQEEAYKLGSAVKYSEFMGIPLEEAYKNVDAYNEANFTNAQGQKGRYEALSDMLTLGHNNVKLGELGQKLMKAQRENDEELAASYMAEIDAINKQNVLMQDNTPRIWVMESLEACAQSLPFTGAVAGAGIIGNFIAPAVGTGAAFAASSYLSAGQEYIDMLANGASPETARIVSMVSGGVQGLIEADLGITSGIVKGTARAMGKEAAENAAKKGLEEIGRKVFKRFHFGSGKKLLVNYLENYGKNVLGEGTEEFLQEITSIVGQEVAASLDGYDIPDDDFKHIVKQTSEAFRGGILGALSMGFIPAGINGAADIKEYKLLKDTAEVYESEEMFKDAVKESPIFEGMSDEAKSDVINEVWQRAQTRKEEYANAEARNIAEVQDAAEGAEERAETPEGEESEAAPVARDEAGKLMFSDDENINDDGTVKGTFRAGDKTKAENNRYGYINYTADEKNKTVTIDDFKMTQGREGLRSEVYDEFARKYAGYNIEWNTTGSEATAIKESIIENNPRGAKSGLAYYADENAVADASTRAKVAAEVRANIHDVVRVMDENGNVSYKRTELSNKQVSSAVALLEAAAKRTGMNLTEYVNKTFGNQIFGSKEDFAQAASAQGDKVSGKAGGVNQGIAQNGWKQYGQQVKAVIYAGENADFSTWAHELAHIFQNQLDGDLKKQAEAAFNVINGDWINSKYTFKDGHVDSAAEAFAYGFQDWLKTGQAESEEMKNIFEKFAEFIARAFNSLKEFINLTPEITSVYDQLLKGDDSLMAQAERAVEEEDRRYRAQMKQQAEDAVNARRAEAEQQKKSEEAEREEASETTDFTEKEKAPSADELLKGIEEAENETKETNNAIDDALKNSNLTDEKKTQIADVLKDETTTVEEKAEAMTDAASSAYDDEEDYKSIPDDLFFQLAGEPSIRRMAEGEERERILTELKAAQLMDEKYKNMDESSKAARIRRATGWEKDSTGAWKYELDDSINRIKTEVFKNNPELLTDSSTASLLNLGDILDAPELYKVFPYMKNVRVSFYSDPNAFRAVLTPNGIMVNTRYLKGMNGETGLKGVLAHEIQHVIQAMEFAESKGLQGADIKQLYNDVMDAMKAAGEKKYDYDTTSLQNGLDAYMKDAGEIEARNVARRILMNADERRMNTLASTEDVKRNLLFQNEFDEVKAQYENTENWMKAPNGADSNLNEKQWVQVRTPSFKKWFGDWEKDPANASKVVDENGEPLVVYHGSSQWFQVFNEGKTNKSSNVNTPDNTIFTNDNKEIASSFQNYYGGKVTDVILDENSPLHRKYDWGTYRAGGVYSLFMNLRNPKIVDYKGQTWKADGMNINDEVAKAMQEGYDGFIAKNIIDVGFTDVTPPASNDYIAFNNTDVKSATDNNGNFDASNPNILFQIAGEIGAENLDNSEVQDGVSRMQNLAIAKQMETDGKDAQTIRLATGWEKGTDGKWKYEIDDSKIKISDHFYPEQYFYNKYPRLKELEEKLAKNIGAYDEFTEEERADYDYYSEQLNKLIRSHIDFENGKETWIEPASLEDVIYAPELFKAYPQLATLKFIVKDLGPGNLGQYDGEMITVSPSAPKSVLLHEIQLAIQDIEGFAKGGSSEQFSPISIAELEDEIKGHQNNIDLWQKDIKLGDFVKKSMQEVADGKKDMDQHWKDLDDFINNSEFAKEINTEKERIEELKARIEEIEENALDGQVEIQGRTYMDENEAYRSLAGEVEARNVQERMKFTPGQRINTLLAATEDVRPEDKIILFQTVYHGSGADFDKFDTENYGYSGEGSMSFGYGTYVTDSEEIARDYAERQRKRTLNKESTNPYERGSLEYEMFEDLRSNSFNFSKSLYKKYLEKEVENIKKDPDNPYQDFKASEKLAIIDNLVLGEEDNKTNLYTVEIPDDGYLEWNKEIPLQDVIKIVNRFINYTAANGFDLNVKKLELPQEWSYDGEITGRDLYARLDMALYGANTNKVVSRFLNSIGYAGIKYPAGTIHGNGNGAYNYVIFNDDDAKIVNHLFYQTEAELAEEAQTFDSWQDFMEYCEVMHAGDEVSPIPYTADAQWYQSFYENAHGVQTEQEKNEEAVIEKNKKEGILPGAVDAYFSTMIRTNPELVDNFVKTMADIDAIDLDSEEWQHVDNAEDAKQRERIDELKVVMRGMLRDYIWGTAIKRIQGGHELTEGMRKRLIGEMLDNFKVRDFRALYSEVMEDEQYAVAEEDSTAAILSKRLSKYKNTYDIMKPGEDIALVSPERRKQIAEALQNRELAEKIRNGSLKLDDEIEAYLKSLNKQIKELQKNYDELEIETQNDYQRLADAERRKLLKLHEELLLSRGRLKNRDAETERKIKKGLKITEKYQRTSQNLNADYDELFRKFTDLKNTMQITAEVQAALDRQERVAGIKEDLNNKQKEKSLVAEVKKMRIQLVKRAMRRVPFNRIDYENARTVIAIQRMLEPNLLGGVNRFIGIDSAYLRGVISGIVTDAEYKEKILNYLRKQDKSSQAFVDFLKKVEDLKSIKDFDSWTAKERKYAIKHLPKENWVRDLNLLQLAKEREESIDLDIGMKEKQVPRIDPKTGEPMTDKEGNIIYETAFTLDAADELKKLVRDAVGADMFDLITDKPFAEWTTEELERLAQRIDELYTEGRDLKAAKDEARKREADAIRKRVEDAIKETGITINDDDTPEEKERKLKQNAKILNLKAGLKGTEAGKDSGIKAKFDRLIHGYADANVLRVARILDNYSEGENVRLLYRREDECFNNKTRSIMRRGETVKKVMADNKITEGNLAESIKVPGLDTEFTVDELLYFLAADKDFEIDEKKASKAGLSPLDMNDDYAATSRNAVMFGNMMSDNASQAQKEAWAKMDREMQEAIENDALTAEQKQLLAVNQLDTRPGTTQFINYCKAKWEICLSAANNFINEHPEYNALLEAIQADYAEQYERMNEISIAEFNTPVHRVRAYVPLVRRESNGADNVAQVKEDLLAAYGGEAGKQWVNKGMTQRRVNISPLNQKPVQTGLFRTWGDSIERTEHFIAYAPYVRQLNAVYKSRDASYTRLIIEGRYGRQMLEYIDSYINEVANPNAGKIRERGAEFLHVLRGKTAPAYLGWKFSGIVKQGLTSPWPYMQFVNPAEYLAAATKCWTSGGKMYDAIKSKSAFMASRVMDPINELVDEMSESAKTKLDRGWSKFTKAGMQGLEWIDWTCVAPGWLACYEKEYNRLQNMSEARYQEKIAELTEKNMTAEIGTSEWMSREQIEAQAKQELMDDIETAAVTYADDCTRACQPSSRLTDLSPLFKNSSEAMKAFLQFQTSLNVIWQNIRYDIPYNIRQKEYRKIVGTVCGYVFAGIFMNSVMEGVKGDDDDDDTQALRNLIFYSTTQFTDAIPMVGSDITNMMDQLITGKRGFAQSGTDMTPSATKIMSALQKVQKGDFMKAAELTTEGIGLFLGAPVSGTKEIYKLLGKPLSEGDVNLKRGVGDVYGLAGDIIGE